MPEQNSQNVKAFDPASFSMPAQPTPTYSVIANGTGPELSSYVQTVHHRPLGTITPGARLSDQAPARHRTVADMRSQRQDTQTYHYAPTNTPAPQPPAPPMSNGVSKYQQSSVPFNLSDHTTGSTEVGSYQPNQNQSFAPPADRSNLPYVPRTEVSPTQQTDSSAPFVDASDKETQETENQSSIAKEAQFAIARTKLIDLRQGSNQTETPQRDENTIAQKPTEFLKREAFSNKFKVTPSSEREFQKAGRSSKVIYLKSVPPVDHTAKLHVPKLVQERAPEPVAGPPQTQPPQTQPPQPQIIQWPMVDSAQDQVLFPAPVVIASPAPMEVDFVSTTPANDAETTKIDFAEVSMEASAAPASDQTAEATFNPFQTAEETTEDVDSTFDPFQTTENVDSTIAPFQTSETSEAPDQDSPFKSTPGPPPTFDSPQEQTTPVKSSPFESTPEASSPFQSTPEEPSPFESSPFESAPEEAIPFQSTPDDVSPFRSTLFQSPSSPSESENVTQLSGGEVSVTQSQSKSLAEPTDDFAVPSPPVPTVSLATKKQDAASKFDAALSKQNTFVETFSAQLDFSSSASASSSNSQDSPFYAIAHRRPETKDPGHFTRTFENNASQAVEEPKAEILLPSFKAENAHQHFTATTLQSDYRSEARSEQPYEMPWLSPWWMLIGLIPILLYVGTMKFFKDEDEYHSHKAELFSSHLEFGSDFGEIGRSKSDATYGRKDPAPTVRGPSGEAVRLEGGSSQSALDFAETLEFALPLSTEVNLPTFGPELRIDQSPNFSESLKIETGRKNKQRQNNGKKRNGR